MDFSVFILVEKKRKVKGRMKGRNIGSVGGMREHLGNKKNSMVLFSKKKVQEKKEITISDKAGLEFSRYATQKDEEGG